MIFADPKVRAVSVQIFTTPEVLDYISSLSIISETGWFIAGSFPTAIKTLCTWNDLDIFFEDEETYKLFLKHYTQKHEFRWSSDNAKCYEVRVRKSTYASKVLEINLVKRFGTIEEILNTFDLNVCKNALTPKLELITLCNTDIIKIEKYTSNILHRVLKYMNKGFKFYDYDLLFEKIMRDGTVKIAESRTYEFGDVSTPNVTKFSNYTEMYDFIIYNVKHMLENKVCNDILKVLDKHYVGADICKYVNNDMIEAVDFMQHMKNKHQFELTNIDLKMVLHYKFNYDFACDIDLFKEKYPEYYI